MRILFIADQYADAPRSKRERHAGGAELTDAVAIDACPYPIDLVEFRALDVATLPDYDLHIVGNSATATHAQLRALAACGRHVSFEHDLRICRWRGNFPASLEPLHRGFGVCACPHRALQTFYTRARGVVFLTALQQRWFDANPFFPGAASAILGSSLFDAAFFERVERLDPARKREGAAIFGSPHRIKGYKEALNYTQQHGMSPLVIRELSKDEVLDVFESSEHFVYLPRGPEWAGRMPVEARFLGCEVITNERVGVAGEPWWSWRDEEALAYLRRAPARFWELVLSF